LILLFAVECGVWRCLEERRRKESSSKLGGGSPNLSTFGALKTPSITSFKGL